MARAKNDSADDLISQLEDQIEQLRIAATNSERTMFAGQVAAWTGGLALLSFALGIIGLHPVGIILAVSMIVGGLVLAGSSKRTTDDIRDALERADAARRMRIDALPLKPLNQSDVHDPPAYS